MMQNFASRLFDYTSEWLASVFEPWLLAANLRRHPKSTIEQTSGSADVPRIPLVAREEYFLCDSMVPVVCFSYIKVSIVGLSETTVGRILLVQHHRPRP